MIVYSANRCVLLLLCLGLTTAFFGCTRPPVVETPALEVIVSTPRGAKPDLVEPWDEYTGTVDARESVEVRSRVRGEIRRMTFAEGEEIEAGKDLFLIDSGPFEAALLRAQGDLKTAESELKLANEKIALYEPLEKKKSISTEELLKAFADKGKAIGSIGVAEGRIMDAKLDIGYCRIRAPISGKVGEAMLTVGNMVDGGGGAASLLTTIVSVDPMYVFFNVNESKYQEYRELLRKNPEFAQKETARSMQVLGSSTLGSMSSPLGGPLLTVSALVPERPRAKIPVQLFVAGRTEPYKGEVDFVDNRVAPGTGSIKVRARFDNPVEGGLRRLAAGLFARVRISLEKPRPAILVPDRAILSDQSLKYVLLVNKDKGNIVERKDVEASDRLEADGRREVKGLNEDEWVIVEGVNRVRPGVTVVPKVASK